MTSTVLFGVWCFMGMVILGLCRIKPPQDTPDGKEHPDVAFLAWTVMLVAWPLTAWNRKKFARFGVAGDEGNPSWLSDRHPM